MNEFVTWTVLATYGGALAMVTLLTQLTKGLKWIKDLPTQVWSYILAVVTLICATAFTTGLTIEGAVLILFNAVLISLASNGGYSFAQRLIEGKTDSNG